MGARQKERLRTIVDALEAERRGRENHRKRTRSVDFDTAEDYIEHYRLYGWRYFTREHCPARIYDQVARAAPREAA